MCAIPPASLLRPQLSALLDGEHLPGARIFDSDRFKLKFVQSLGDLREELGFRIVGYVLMPEHCHLLIWPSDLANPPKSCKSSPRF